MSLQGYKALVCGSTQGIGLASAIQLSEMGAEITLMARNEERLIAAKQQLKGDGHQHLVADFSNSASLKTILSSHIAEGNNYHILVNNTGGPAGGPIAAAETTAFLAAFEQHLICNHILAQAVLPAMREAQFGRIINVISTSVKAPLKGLGVSNTIRAAVGNWSKTLSIEVAADGITVNNVLPGATETARLTSIIANKAKKQGKTVEEVREDMLAEIPAKSFGKAEDIAAAVGYLASKAARYITGINIPVDGGRTPCL